MKTHLLPAIKLSFLCVLLFVVFYTGIVWGIAQVAAPNRGKGEVMMNGSKIIGFKLIGQSFTANKYFCSRPSAVNYHADGSAGSNKGPSNPEYLAEVEKRISYFLANNPDIRKEDIPVELVTASGSGLDPDISPTAALIQVPQIAKARGLKEEQLTLLVSQYTKSPFLFGPSTINVLELNLALDKMK